ncbi:MAG: hypothetical protein IPN34_08650 [Planctomycetes bacterium]|nr:hypothetical protein [Planctomycetota bacterium]
MRSCFRARFRSALCLSISTLALPLPLAFAQDASAPRSREARVLDVLRKLPTEHLGMLSTPLLPRQNAFGSRIYAIELRGLCGNGWMQAFQPALARELALKLAEIYGWQPAIEVAAPHQVAAVLDLYDAERALGIELRGRVSATEIGSTKTSWPIVVAEDSAHDLSPEDARTLRERGVRLHVAEVEAFWGAHSQDSFTSVLGYLAGVIEFLNETSDGEDVSVEALVAARSLCFDWPAIPVVKGLAVERFEGGAILVASERCRVVLRFDPTRATTESGALAGERIDRRIAPRARVPRALSLHGRATQLQLLGFGEATAAHRATLLQVDTRGVARELGSTSGSVLFAPSAFESARPFELHLDLQPGRHRLDHGLWIAAPEDLLDAPSKPR